MREVPGRSARSTARTFSTSVVITGSVMGNSPDPTEACGSPWVGFSKAKRMGSTSAAMVIGGSEAFSNSKSSVTSMWFASRRKITWWRAMSTPTRSRVTS